jgi:hypothetical protein
MGPENTLAVSIGMSNTALRQSRIGCGFVGAVRNDFTLAHSAIDTLGTGAETFRSEIRAALSTW